MTRINAALKAAALRAIVPATPERSCGLYLQWWPAGELE